MTDKQLHILVAAGDKDAADCLRERIITKLRRRMPNPTGVCPHGKRIEWDCKGAYSSGYPMGCNRCMNSDTFRQIVNDPPDPETLRINALIAHLKSAIGP